MEARPDHSPTIGLQEAHAVHMEKALAKGQAPKPKRKVRFKEKLV
jgi:hypothetical protein